MMAMQEQAAFLLCLRGLKLSLGGRESLSERPKPLPPLGFGHPLLGNAPSPIQSVGVRRLGLLCFQRDGGCKWLLQG